MLSWKDNAESIIKNILELDAIEFLGICKIIGVDIYKQTYAPYVEGAPAKTELKARPFVEIWSDVCDTIGGMNRTKRRNLNKLVKAAIKKEK